MITLGLGLELLLHAVSPVATYIEASEDYTVPITYAESVAFCVASISFLLTPFLAFLLRRFIPVLGSIYCLSTGLILTFIASFLEELREPMLLALIITIVLVATMQQLYFSGRIIDLNWSLLHW